VLALSSKRLDALPAPRLNHWTLPVVAVPIPSEFHFDNEFMQATRF
jgi:hypothetical protein